MELKRKKRRKKIKRIEKRDKKKKKKRKKKTTLNIFPFPHPQNQAAAAPFRPACCSPKYRPRINARIQMMAMTIQKHHHFILRARRADAMPLSSWTLPASVSFFTFSVCCSVPM